MKSIKEFFGNRDDRNEFLILTSILTVGISCMIYLLWCNNEKHKEKFVQEYCIEKEDSVKKITDVKEDDEFLIKITDLIEFNGCYFINKDAKIIDYFKRRLCLDKGVKCIMMNKDGMLLPEELFVHVAFDPNKGFLGIVYEDSLNFVNRKISFSKFKGIIPINLKIIETFKHVKNLEIGENYYISKRFIKFQKGFLYVDPETLVHYKKCPGDLTIENYHGIYFLDSDNISDMNKNVFSRHPVDDEKDIMLKYKKFTINRKYIIEKGTKKSTPTNDCEIKTVKEMQHGDKYYLEPMFLKSHENFIYVNPNMLVHHKKRFDSDVLIENYYGIYYTDKKNVIAPANPICDDDIKLKYKLK